MPEVKWTLRLRAFAAWLWSGRQGVIAGLAASHDRGAESPRETWLRLLLIRAGYPRPRTQIPVCDETGEAIYFLDMGWEDVMVAVEYDGDQHRERPRFGKDIIRSEYLAYLHWTHIRVVAGARPADVLNRVQRAWAASVRTDCESA